jgi:signal transduction histidine kinase
MSERNAGPPRVRPRQSLSGRLWLLTTLAVLLSEVVVFLPYIARERTTWMVERVEDATIAALAANGGAMDPARRDELLQLSGTEAIQLTGRDGKALTVGNVPALPDASFDLREEDLLVRIRRALRAIVIQDDRLVHVTGDSPFKTGGTVELWLHERELSRTLRQFAGDFAGLALLIALVAGGLVYGALLFLLVRPLRRITGSIAAFRADPERTTPLDPANVSVLSDDEISIAGRELAAMQHELRAALWRNARLAALGTVVAKVSHDLRGILTPALLTAERLQLNTDPRVQRAGEVLTQAVDRATELVGRTLDYAREGPPPLDLASMELAPLVNEAAETARAVRRALQLENSIDASIVVRVDRTQFYRVLTNLMRNAAEAGAQSLRVSAHQNSPTVMIEITDDGPGLPEQVRGELFRPFAGSMRRGGTGLGLAIARDLMVAHGGDIELVSTGVTGTTFRLTLRVPEQKAPADPALSQARIAPAASAEI